MVEICIDGVWGTVCDYFNEWNDDNSAVICRQLNLPTSGIVKALYISAKPLVCVNSECVHMYM